MTLGIYYEKKPTKQTWCGLIFNKAPGFLSRFYQALQKKPGKVDLQKRHQDF